MHQLGHGAGPQMPPPFDDEEEGGGLDPRRIIAAVVRYRWLVVATFVLGTAAAVVFWNRLDVRYTTMGSLWVEQERRSTNPGDVLPIRVSGLFETTAYIDVMKSLSVLLPVVESQKLYLDVGDGVRDLFAGFQLEERFVPGSYTLTVDPAGASWTLTHAEAGVIDRGQAGEAIGEDAGIVFHPPADWFPPGIEIGFRLKHPQQAARELSNSLIIGTDVAGNFLRVSYSGTDPGRIADVLNAVLESHIEVAAELKRDRLDETQVVLEEQLVYAQELLSSAERQLEDFRVRTITLPSDQATPIAGGLQMTRDPVFGNYFNMQTDLEAVRRDRDRLAGIFQALPDTSIPVETLEAIPAASGSRELQQVLDELVDLRAELRVYRDRYSDQYPPIQEILTRIGTIQTETVPRVLRGLIQELNSRETRIVALVDSASAALAEIPTRTIEEARLERQVETQETLYNDLRSRVENARLASASSVPDVRILDRAVVPDSPSDDPRVLFAGLFLIGGLGSGILAALLLDRLDRRIRYPTQVDRDIGLTILGSIPRVEKAGAKGGENQAAVVEAFRELRISLGFAFGSAGPIMLTVSSPSQGEGKTFISTNLAVAFADMGRRTLLIDGDTRRGDAHRMLGLERCPGLTDYLKERTAGEIIQSTRYENLDFIGGGARGSHTPELLASTQMSRFLGTLKRAYDVIIIDSPPLSGGGDALVLSSLTGNLAVVLRSGSTDKALAAAKIETLSRFPIRVLGAVLNDTDPGGLYGYYATYLPSYLTPVDADEENGPGLGAPSQLVAPGVAKDEADR
ncbi:MAG: polysaccharide biosynthesis tyrosine autokinase [Longimicrobiales bacterium]